MPTSAINPGSFAPRRPLRARVVLSRAVRELRKGHVRAAGVGAAVDLINLAVARIGTRLAPRLRCPCCGHEARAFVHMHDELRTTWNSACPACDSRSRHRALALFLPPQLGRAAPRAQRVLHVAPEAVLRRSIAAVPGLVYETSDLHLADVTHTGEDLEALSFADGSYDVILCNHVLEHLEHDDVAIRELARVLSDDGFAVITIPGEFDGRPTTIFPDTSRNGHYRDYGLDVVELFRTAFATVDVVDLHALDKTGDGLSAGIKRGETAFMLSRPRRRPA